MNDLIPKDAFIGKAKLKLTNGPDVSVIKKPVKLKRKSFDPSVGIEPDMYRYTGNVNPFKDSKEFVKYYRAFVHLYNNEAKFPLFSVDVQFAGLILDMLMDSNRKEKAFLDGWIKFYCENKLRGEKIKKPKHTSLFSFKDTFKKYNEIFYTF